MGKIRVLEQSVANQIAAGEVVERPASVVKELVENAVDAGATAITVEIKNGGRTLIRVTDNGSGMERGDAELSLLRHATSKVRCAEDLAAILTLGFRGEALASIAAVSELEMQTRTAETDVGTRLLTQAGELLECEDIGCPKGTTILVKNLFSNTPARLKFLKKDMTEGGYITDVVNRLALSNPNVSFRYLRDGKEILYTAGDNDLGNCVFSVFGREVARSMLPVDYTENHIQVSGLTGKPDIARANRNFQSFFLNGRYIKSALLAHALDEAYQNQLMTGKFPACVLSLTVDPTFVDVNVHPTKLEVKFSDERAVYHAVYWAVRNGLYAKPNIPEVTMRDRRQLAAEADQTAEPSAETGRTAEKREAIAADTGAERRPTPDAPPAMDGRNAPERVRPFHNEIVFTRPRPRTEADRPLMAREMEEVASEPAPPVPPAAAGAAEQPAEPEAVRFEQAAATEPVEPVVIGQVFATYIIVEKGDEMYLIDQHAAHERLRYEELRRQAEERAVISQGLLVPVVVELTGAEAAILAENMDFFEGLGFELEPFGNASVIIRSSPEELSEGAMKEFFVECVDMLRNRRTSKLSDMQSRALYSISCKGALKANARLDRRAMEALVRAVFALPNINTCPHGRPIVISFPKHMIEKQFKRIV